MTTGQVMVVMVVVGPLLLVLVVLVEQDLVEADANLLDHRLQLGGQDVGAGAEGSLLEADGRGELWSVDGW